MDISWKETARGRALYVGVDGRHVAFYEPDLQDVGRLAATAAISFWEGANGLVPRGRLARWLWRRGLKKLQGQIAKEVVAYRTAR